MSKLSDIDMALVIIASTNDGGNLSPYHLWFVQGAVNGGLTDEGREWFIEHLYLPCKNGTYVKPCHLGVEFMTKDHDSYILYKGVIVEHYTFYDDPEGEEEKESLMRLQKACILKEKKEGIDSLGMMFCY